MAKHARQPLKSMKTVAGKRKLKTKVRVRSPNERQRLLAVLAARVARKLVGAEELRAKVRTLTDKTEQLEFLKRHVFVQDEVGRPGKPFGGRTRNHEYGPSVGNQVGETGAEHFGTTVFYKTFLVRSIALRRTLLVYGHLRETGLESTVPLHQP